MMNSSGVNMLLFVAWFIATASLVHSADVSCPLNCTCPELAMVNCSRSNLRELPLTGYESDVEEVDFSFNNITSIQLNNEQHNLTARVANFSHNQISNIATNDFKLMPSIKEVDFSWNFLANISFQTYNAPELSWLSLAGNSEIFSDDQDSFIFSHSLMYLSLSHCNITTIPKHAFKNLPMLHTLDLSQNRIRQLEKNTFSAVSNLQYLDLSSNQLSCISPNVFSQISNLNVLDVSNNLLPSIPEVLLITNDKVTNETGNETLSLDCACNLNDFYVWCNNNKVNLKLVIKEQFNLTSISNETWDDLNQSNCSSLSNNVIDNHFESTTSIIKKIDVTKEVTSNIPKGTNKQEKSYVDTFEDLDRPKPRVRMDALDICAILVVYATILGIVLYCVCKVVSVRLREKYRSIYNVEEVPSMNRIIRTLWRLRREGRDKVAVEEALLE